LRAFGRKIEPMDLSLPPIPQERIDEIEAELSSPQDSPARYLYDLFISEGFSHNKTIEMIARYKFNLYAPDAKVYVKENPAYYLFNDAEKMIQLSRRAKSRKNPKLENSYARMAILLYAISLEAFINVVYEYSETPKSKALSKMSVKQKWLNAPKDCLPHLGEIQVDDKIIYQPGDSVATFDENSELFQSYLELKKMRNEIVHLKPIFYETDYNSIEKSIFQTEYYKYLKIPQEKPG